MKLRCIDCGVVIKGHLADCGSLRCHDCKDEA